MVERRVLEGSHAVAHAVRCCQPDVVSAYPITPQTHIVEKISQFVADGDLKSEYMRVESEFSAMSASVGASATGARTFTATASQGLMLMSEVLYNASGLRLPIVMSVANRAMGAPINIWNDHSDSMGVRDSGWIQLYAEDNQEALDMTIQAYRIAEDEDVRIPAMVCMDGFILTHTYEPVSIPKKEKVQEFLPEYDPEIKLDPENPLTMGTVGFPSDYMEIRHDQYQGMENARDIMPEVFSEFEETFGREQHSLIETYKTDDAEIILVSLGSVMGTVKEAVDEMREDGESVGAIKVRAFRPFPDQELTEALQNAEAVAVLDKNITLGKKGALHTEMKDTLYSADNRPLMKNYIIGLGGRDIPRQSIKNIVDETKDDLNNGQTREVRFVDLKEE
ncbi:pyruvate synthase subunit PorA [Methanonatronarchaeum sp. AMET6-2]|uniref:pyruvate synthase subunit PorA n=1 Tax=Methanonatronarchaeum sp. AMET6-2 TaxID=2933293 RepID=UPI00120CC1E0|nr:pyruvate synthase subunit PorA [Methanonatronarchaeum sp. AMET6-2]RZN62143.1 MAG: pyruvate ferredoxin oxidoreductase [Methanonatronarchaeia archaeon]UOY09660.1 pyruvate synthase subunit PorA [Methanonatronarchaeum sp. AMET6-2]